MSLLMQDMLAEVCWMLQWQVMCFPHLIQKAYFVESKKQILVRGYY